MTVIQEAPPAEHTCEPGKECRAYDPAGVDPLMGVRHDSEIFLTVFGTHYWHDLHLPSGTVWECDCGRVWVAEWIPDRVSRRWVHCAHVEWRPEKRRERRRRLRAAA